MNRTSFYSYSIITGVWNDLSNDIISLIKNYIYTNLNRKLLNKDYNVSLENLLNNTNTKNNNILFTRYGLKNNINSGYIDENTGEYVNHILLDTVMKFKSNYYVLGIKINPMYDSGFNNYDRNHIILRYMKKHYTNSIVAYNNAKQLICNQAALKRYIRLIMDHEESKYN